MLLRRLGGEDIPGLRFSFENQFSLRKTYVSVVQQNERVVWMFGCDDGDTHGCMYLAKLQMGGSQKYMVVGGLRY
jgi:hypothetical protein